MQWIHFLIRNIVPHREARGRKKTCWDKIRHDDKLCKLLVDYEARSEIIGMMDFVRNLKMKPPRFTSRQTAIWLLVLHEHYFGKVIHAAVPG